MKDELGEIDYSRISLLYKALQQRFSQAQIIRFAPEIRTAHQQDFRRECNTWEEHGIEEHFIGSKGKLFWFIGI